MKKWAVTCIVSMLLMFSFLNLVPQETELVDTGNKNEVPILYNDMRIPDDYLEREGTKGTGPEPLLPEPGYTETSEYLMGSVAVGTILSESNGVIDPSTEDWTAGRIAIVRSEVMQGLSWWDSEESNATLNFVYNWTHTNTPVDIDYEFITYTELNHPTIIEAIMGAIGYTSGNHFTRVRAYINDLRAAHNTDWAFAIFIADSDNDADGKFPDVLAYAWLGGPYQVMSYDVGGFGNGNLDKVVAHETGHTFWSVDEYSSSGCTVTQRTGYLDVDNPNCENGGVGDPNIMNDNTLVALNGTRRQLGWNDSDGDSVMDILDVPPTSTLVPYVPDPTNDNTPTFSGSAVTVAFPNNNPNPWNSGNDVTINKIADIEYRVDNGTTIPWTGGALAVDGTFDEASEDFTVTTLPLAVPGTYFVDVRAKITVNGVDIYQAPPYSNDTLSIIIDNDPPISSADPLPTYRITPTFQVTATASDLGTGVKNVTLWYSKDGTPYQEYNTDPGSPWQFNFFSAMTGGDGLYEFYTTACDYALPTGNCETVPLTNDTWTIVDTQKPVSSVDALPGYTTTSAFTVDLTVQPDTNGIQQVALWYRRGGGPYISYATDFASPWTFNFDSSTTGGDGTYEFYSIGRDNPGNIEDAPLGNDTFTIVDTQKPVSAVVVLSAYTTVSTFSVDVTAADITSGVTSIELWYDKDSAGYVLYGTDNAFPWSFNFDSSTTSGDGIYEFHSRAYDNAGNYEDAPIGNDTWTIIDTQKPSSSVDALPAYTTTSTINIDVTAQPDATGIQSIDLWYSKDGFPFAFYSTDNTFPWSFTFNTILFGGDGTYEFYSIAHDSAGNTEDAPILADATTLVDTQKPISSVNSLPAYTTTSSFTVDVTAFDSMSGLQSIELWYDKDGAGYVLYNTAVAPLWSFNFDSTTTGGDGIYSFYSRAYDNASNYEDIPISPPDANTMVDTLKPASLVQPLPTYTITGAFVVTVTASDDTSGLQYVQLWYSKDGAPYQMFGNDTVGPWIFNFDTSTTGGDGTYEFYSLSCDNAALYENMPIGNDTWTIVDTQYPISSADALPAIINVTSFTVDVTAFDQTSGVLKVELWYSFDYSLYVLFGNDTTPPWSFDIDTLTYDGDGFYQFYSKAFDSAGNIEFVAFPINPDTSIMVDSKPPEIQITAPPQTGWMNSAEIDVSWIGSDETSGIAYYELGIDGGALINKSLVNQHTYLGLTEGSHALTLRAFDYAGNGNTTSSSFFIDISSPDLIITSPANNTNINSSTVTVSWDGSDSGSEIDHYEIKLDDGDYFNVHLSTQYIFTDLSDGKHTVLVRAVDNTGWAAESYIEFRIGEEDGNGGEDPPEPTFLETLIEYWWLWLLPIIIVIVIVIVAVLLAKRRKKDDEEKGK